MSLIYDEQKQVGYGAGLSYQQYEELPGVRSTNIKNGLASMAHFKYSIDEAELEDGEKRDTEAMKFGRAFHSALLEPHDFRARLVVKPDFGKGDGSRKKMWAWEEELELTQPDAIVMKQKTLELLSGMRDSFLKHAVTKRFFGAGEKGDRESVIVWHNPDTGLACKARIDYWTKAYFEDFQKTVVFALDLKSTTVAEGEAFGRDAHKMGYDISAAHYSEGLSLYLGEPVEFFAFGAVEKTPPFGVRFFLCDPTFLESGQERRLHVLKQIAESTKANEWPCYRERFENLYLPDYIMRRAEEKGTYVV